MLLKCLVAEAPPCCYVIPCLLLKLSQIVDYAEGEALRGKIVGTEDSVPHLVLVFAARRESADQAYVGTACRGEYGSGVLLVAAGAGKVEISDSHEVLDIRTNPVFTTPLIHGTGLTGRHAMTWQVIGSCVIDVAALEFNPEPAEFRRHVRQAPVNP